MIKRKFVHILLIVLLLSNLSFSYAYWASSVNGDQDIASATLSVGTWNYENIVSMSTGFEDVSKTSYASGEIETYGYTWLLDDALIGTLNSDLKNDDRSVRLRNGVLQSRFGVSELKSISFYVGVYGSDTPTPISLELSDDQISWHNYTNITVTTSFVQHLIEFDETQVSNLGLSISDELYIRFKSTNSQRANIDDVVIEYNDAQIIVLEDYYTGFEASQGFEASTSYNNTTIKYEGNVDKQWGFYYGTPSKTGAISESQSAQMRWYSSTPSNLGYMFSDFDTYGVQSITFLAKRQSTINVKVSISIDGGITWIEEQLYNLTTSTTLYTYTVNPMYVHQNLRVKFTIDFVSTPANTSRLYIDEVNMLTDP